MLVGVIIFGWEVAQGVCINLRKQLWSYLWSPGKYSLRTFGHFHQFYTILAIYFTISKVDLLNLLFCYGLSCQDKVLQIDTSRAAGGAKTPQNCGFFYSSNNSSDEESDKWNPPYFWVKKFPIIRFGIWPLFVYLKGFFLGKKTVLLTKRLAF